MIDRITEQPFCQTRVIRWLRLIKRKAKYEALKKRI